MADEIKPFKPGQIEIRVLKGTSCSESALTNLKKLFQDLTVNVHAQLGGDLDQAVHRGDPAHSGAGETSHRDAGRLTFSFYEIEGKKIYRTLREIMLAEPEARFEVLRDPSPNESSDSVEHRRLGSANDCEVRVSIEGERIISLDVDAEVEALLKEIV